MLIVKRLGDEKNRTKNDPGKMRDQINKMIE